ncbi:MAG: hypothetical protein WBE26_19740 [Phycisphaerae bacterium]
MYLRSMAACSLSLMLLSGCALQEIRSKTSFGPEYQHFGSTNTNSVRWTAVQGLDFKWDKGITTGVTYQRRDVDDGNGNNENRVLLEFSFPLWKAESKQTQLARRVRRLEDRLVVLEAAVQHGEN